IEPVTVSVADLPDYLGPERVRPERYRRELPAGVSTGLAWTEAGGDVLYVEATLLRDGKGLHLTGQLGDVMRESARTARPYVWPRKCSMWRCRARLVDLMPTGPQSGCKEKRIWLISRTRTSPGGGGCGNRLACKLPAA